DKNTELIDPAVGFYAWKPYTNENVVDAVSKTYLGLPPDAPIDFESWHRRLHKDDLPRIDAAIARCLDPRHGVYDVQYRFHGWDGTERCIKDVAHAVFKDGMPFRWIGMHLDITGRPRTDNEAQRALPSETHPMRLIARLDAAAYMKAGFRLLG